MDLFHIEDHTYLACADRQTGWVILHCLKPDHTTTTKLMSICQQLFQTHGAPEGYSNDSGLSFTSSAFQEFHRTWFVKHRLFSVTYPRSNVRSDLTMKTAKRIVNWERRPQGPLDNDNVAQAILQN